MAFEMVKGVVASHGDGAPAAGGGAASSQHAKVTNPSGGPILGHLSIGGARLSFALADVVSQVYGDGACSVVEWTGGCATAPPVAEVLQELLEAPSTTDRLRLVLRRMQEARRALSG